MTTPKPPQETSPAKGKEAAGRSSGNPQPTTPDAVTLEVHDKNGQRRAYVKGATEEAAQAKAEEVIATLDKNKKEVAPHAVYTPD